MFLNLIEQEVSTSPTCCSKKLPYELGKSHVNYRSGKFDMAEVAWTFTSTLSARLASKAWVYDSKPWIHKTHFNGETIVVVSISGNNLGYAHLSIFFR